MEALEVAAPAKVNLGLSVLGRRQDGYHELHTLFAALAVGDLLRITPRPEGVTLRVTGATLSAGPDNLVYRAAKAYLSAAGDPGGVDITLDKRLPLAAGLGGGSSDAAAALLALARLYPAPVDLPTVALGLGADVPFFLGPPLAEGRGVGERLAPLDAVPLHLVLVNPGLAVAAAAAYRHLRPDEWQPELDVSALLGALLAGEEPPYWNTLERPVFRLEPTLGQLKSELRAAGLRGVLMSGSGSTLFGLAEDPDHALHLARKLGQRFPGFWIKPTRTLG